MNNRFFLWIASGFLVVLLAACGLVGTKSDIIKCAGTQTFDFSYSNEGWNKGDNFSVDYVWTFNLESDCPELNGVMKVTENASPGYDSGYNYTNWGIYRFETAYDGGGVFEGTYHGTMKNGVLNAESTSYNATGSLSGLQLIVHSLDYVAGYTSMKFEATIQNPPEQ